MLLDGLQHFQHLHVSSIAVSSKHTGEDRQCLIVKIMKEPVNAMDLSLWSELATVLDAAEKSFREAAKNKNDHNAPRVCGIIWSSGLVRNIFTAGNDINELHAKKTTKQRYKHFWKVSNEFLARLYCSPLATVAAVKVNHDSLFCL